MIHRWLLNALCVLVWVGSVWAQPLSSRPFNSFNLRNLRISFPAPTARYVGMGGAGIGLADDPGANSLNPAGSALFSRPAVAFSTWLVYQEVEEPSLNCAGAPLHQEQSELFVDQVFLSTVVPMGRLRLGTYRQVHTDRRIAFEVFKPFRYNPSRSPEENLQRNFPTQETLLRTQLVDNSLMAAFQIRPQLSLGIGIHLFRLDYHLTEREYFHSGLHDEPVCLRSEISPENLYLIRTADARKWGLGLTVGIMSRLSSRLFFGAVYRLRPAFFLDNRILLPRFVLTDSLHTVEFPTVGHVESRFPYRLPDSFGFSLAYKQEGTFHLVMDLVRTRYSELVHFSVTSPADAGPHPTDLIQDNRASDHADPDGKPDIVLEDIWEIHAGFEYVLRTPRLPWTTFLRAGYYREPTTIPYSQQASPEFRASFPREAPLHHFTVGLGIFTGKHLRLDGAMDIRRDRVTVVGSSVFVL
ncbi:MAG: hypothetical protein D6681_21885 [Calditrichaeota bacterium]|nr:MAG: hypothetical protein D6681_21885 [Calditrichota bacterium]